MKNFSKICDNGPNTRHADELIDATHYLLSNEVSSIYQRKYE